MSEPVDDWAEYAAEWDDDEGARIYAARAHDHLVTILGDRGPSLDGAAVCDFGCGTGLLTELIVDRVEGIDAVDASPAMLDQLRSKIDRRGWTTVRAHAELPPSDVSFDLIVCSSVLTFVDDHPATVAELAGRVRPGGALVHWDWERTAEHDHGLTRSEVREALAAAGLVDLMVEPAFEFRIEGDAVWPIVGAGWAPDQPSV